jgi:hypothetical protein
VLTALLQYRLEPVGPAGDDADDGTLRRELGRELLADARRRAGDEDALAFDLHDCSLAGRRKPST